jgi:hypothetical protein
MDTRCKSALTACLHELSPDRIHVSAPVQTLNEWTHQGTSGELVINVAHSRRRGAQVFASVSRMRSEDGAFKPRGYEIACNETAPLRP